jgi:protein SCO1/2
VNRAPVRHALIGTLALAGLLAGCGSDGGTAAPANTALDGHAAAVVATQPPVGTGTAAITGRPSRPTALAGSAQVTPEVTPQLDHPEPDGLHGFRLNVPLPRPQFVLTDTEGRRYDFHARTKGRATLLYFGYTNCRDQCPTTLAGFARALDKLPAPVRKQVTVVFVTTDPKRDTPAVLREYLRYYRAGFVGLTGTQAEVEAAQRAAAVIVSYPKQEDPKQQEQKANAFSTAHGGGALAYGLDDAAHVTYPAGTSVTDLVHDLPELVAGSAH